MSSLSAGMNRHSLRSTIEVVHQPGEWSACCARRVLPAASMKSGMDVLMHSSAVQDYPSGRRLYPILESGLPPGNCGVFSMDYSSDPNRSRKEKPPVKKAVPGQKNAS